MLWPIRRLAAELQLIGTRQLRDHVPLGLEFGYVQLAGQPAPGEKEAWNADALMEGVRAGTGRGDFLAALEDRVKAEEMQWAPLLQLHFPDQLDDYLNKVLVETGSDSSRKNRWMRQAMQNWQREGGSYSRNGWRPGRTLERIVSRGRKAWNVRRSFSRGSRNSWRVHQHLSRQSDFAYGDEDSPSVKRSSDWPGRDVTWRPLSDGAVSWVAVVVGPRRGTTGRCRQHSPRERRGRMS